MVGQCEYYVGVLEGCKHFITSTKILTCTDTMGWHTAQREGWKMEASPVANKSNVMRKNWENENGNYFPCSELRNWEFVLSLISSSNLIS